MPSCVSRLGAPSPTPLAQQMVDPWPAEAGPAGDLALGYPGLKRGRQEFGDRVYDFAFRSLDISSTVALSLKLVEKPLAVAGHAASLGPRRTPGSEGEPLGSVVKSFTIVRSKCPGRRWRVPGAGTGGVSSHAVAP
jgi:hypothetical protein